MPLSIHENMLKMLIYTIIFYAASCMGIFNNIDSLYARQAPAIEGTFNLYAYGASISGLPVFYADGRAEFGDPALSTAEVAQPVYFTVSETSPGTWIAHPNTTEINVAPFSSAVLALSRTETSDGAVEFLEATAEVVDTNSVFSVYGNYVLIDGENVNFYAMPTEAERVYSLIWSDVESEHIAIVLRTIAPATDSVLPDDAI
ncbi:hypothetical protein BJX63DRAFT_387088 [Aspergillus granulosus]|uniref:Uncharacterized protein n=1 Tax=Aspergillus granulosus TaxID=176169 RepID=A0ABR4HMV6_9EURO